jgi:hypothetical protein
MPKKYENMTADERMVYWEKKREQEKNIKQKHVDLLEPSQLKALKDMDKLLTSVLQTAMYNDMGGMRMVSMVEMQDLEEAHNLVKFKFNLGDEDDN